MWEHVLAKWIPYLQHCSIKHKKIFAMNDTNKSTDEKDLETDKKRHLQVVRAIMAQQPNAHPESNEAIVWDEPPEVPQEVADWIEQLGQHVDPFVKESASTSVGEVQLEHVLMTIAQWYVRKDGKYYDVEEPGAALSRDDVERVIIQRIKEEFPSSDLSQDVVRQLLQVLIKDRFVDPRRSIPIWSGLRQSMPGNAQTLTFKRMVATINTWRAPDYRSLGVKEQDFGPFSDFLETTFTRPSERRMLLDWLAWCLQNERDKPGWAPFLYSSTKGSGKSTFAKVAGMLFGARNTATENNFDKLLSRFNAPILERKLVICEELYVPPGSDKANAIKTFITEKETVAEHKYQAVQQVEQVCAFIFITNHKPIWLEPEDRRFYVIEVDHDGHRSGSNADRYAEQVAHLLDYLSNTTNLAKLYNALLAHSVSDTFDPKSLDVVGASTDVMKEISQASGDITRQMVQEWLDKNRVIALNNVAIKALVKERYVSKASAMKYVLSDLGWTQINAKYDNKDYQRSIWLKQGYVIKAGVITFRDGWSLDTADQKYFLGKQSDADLLGYYSRYNREGSGPEPEIDVDY
jgi:hypothetical protein